MSWYFNESIYEDMEASTGFSFPTVEFRGFNPAPRRKKKEEEPLEGAELLEEKKRKGYIY